MSSKKISNLEQISHSNPDNSFIMIVAPDDVGNLKNYRISLSKLANIIGNNTGDITGGLTELQITNLIQQYIENDNTLELTTEQVQTMINNSISENNLKEIVNTVIPEVLPNKLPDVLPEVLPDVLPEVLPDVLSTTEIPISSTPDKTITVTDIVEKLITTENTITEVQEVVNTIKVKIEEETIPDDEADDFFNGIFGNN